MSSPTRLASSRLRWSDWRTAGLLELAAIALAAAVSLAWALWQPPVRDLAGQLFRTEQYEALGPHLWSNSWYGGHHTPGYSLLVPPLAALLGVGMTGVLAAIAAAGCFAALLRHHLGAAAWPGALWLAAATATNLATGRIPFAVGVAFGLGACLAVQRGRPLTGAALGVAAGASNGVAAAFVVLAGLAVAAARSGERWRRDALVLTVAPSVTVVALSALFPSDGNADFGPITLAGCVAASLAVLAVARPVDRTVRAGALLYIAGCGLAYLVPTPLGGTAGRLAALVAGPLILTLLLARHRAGALPAWMTRPAGSVALAVGLLAAFGWQWGPTRRDVHAAIGGVTAPSTRESFYAPLVAQIQRRSTGPVRVEVAFTVTHYEARWVAPEVPIARGWHRQLDHARNSLFYEGRLDAARYARWLRDNGVTWVALPDAPLDRSAEQEARVIRSRPDYLQEVWRSSRWRLFRVLDSPGLASGPGRVVALGADEFVVDARRAGRILVRVRHTRYWDVLSGRACVTRGASGWTEVRVARPGRIRVAARLGSPWRLGGHAQCDAP